MRLEELIRASSATETGEEETLARIEDGSGRAFDMQKFVDSLDDGAQMYAFDANVSFITSDLSAPTISDRFQKLAGCRQFFVADITLSKSFGRILGRFWDLMKDPAKDTAAE